MNAHVLRNSGDTSSEGSTVPVLVYDYRIKRWTFIEKIDVEVKGYSGYFSGYILSMILMVLLTCS